MLEEIIQPITNIFLEKLQEKEVLLISHFDTDGITSATIMIQTLKRLDIQFSVKIIKSLEKEFIETLPKNKVILFLDLASGSLNYLKETEIEDIFIIDHHEIIQEVPSNVKIINPQLNDKQKISSSSLTYLFSKTINEKNKDLAKLAILGMVGDLLEKEIDKLNYGIADDGNIKKKRGLLIYPSTRPLNRVLEYSYNPYIPEVTGKIKGVMELLREAGINPNKGGYKSLIELNEEEMQKLTTAVMLRNPKSKNQELIGDIFLIKMFNKLEDAREISAMINACSRLGHPEIALQICMEIPNSRKEAEAIHVRYKQALISALKFIEEAEKIIGEDFIIINAKNSIQDTIVGTIASILSKSAIYEEGTTITAMAYYKDKIKVSARNVGKNGRNVREMLNRIVTQIGGEVGGHENAAGCLIHQEKEGEFIENLRKCLEISLVKI